jgi:hypothetical protein
MNQQERKEYNKLYYEQNKDVIKSKILKKVSCPLCNRQVNHQNLQRHQQTKLCNSRQPKNNETKPDLTELLQILKELVAFQPTGTQSVNRHPSQAQPVDV